MDNDYYYKWGQYTLNGNPEERFLSTSDEDLMKICDCIAISDSSEVEALKERFSGGMPIHYHDGKLFAIKEGPHLRCCGESGSKKSRTVIRGSIISAALNSDSMVIIDPKGELFSDLKIRWILQKRGIKINVIDFRTFDKDGFNLLGFAYDLYEKGECSRAHGLINSFVSMLVESASHGNLDPFWNIKAGDLIRFALLMMLSTLSKIPVGKKMFNLQSLQNFISQDQEKSRSFASKLLNCNLSDDMLYAVKGYTEILLNPEKTYSSIVSSAYALLSALCSSPELMKMMSYQSFDVRSLYSDPAAIFLVIPDEEKTYDMVTGYMMDTIYHILVDEYNVHYQHRQNSPKCKIHMLCDEVASVFINDLSSKVSASRSRMIDWTLVYQSEKQFAFAYSKDYGTICGNCKNYVFLGSSDHEILTEVSEHTGTKVDPSGRIVPLVTVEDLRRMKKEQTYKDALIRTGNYVLCAMLPDYNSYPFIGTVTDTEAQNEWIQRSTGEDIAELTPELMLKYSTNHIH